MTNKEAQVREKKRGRDIKSNRTEKREWQTDDGDQQCKGMTGGEIKFRIDVEMQATLHRDGE